MDLLNFDELPFELTEEENEQFFSILPDDIKSLFDVNMEMFTEKMMEYVVTKKLNFESIEDYYDSVLSSNYFNKNQILSNSVLFDTLIKFNIEFDIIFIDINGKDVNNHGSMTIVAKTFHEAKKNSFFAVTQQLFGQGEVIRSLTVTKIEKK